MEARRRHVIRTFERQEREGVKVPDQLQESRLGAERLKDLLQNRPREHQVLSIPQQVSESLDRGMGFRSLLPQGERPDRGVDKEPQPRRFRSAL